MKNILSDIFDVLFSLFIFLMIGYGALCILAYTAFAEEAPSKWDERIVAMTILGEARSEGCVGMYAVACVIEQRARSLWLEPKFTCIKRKQFSCWNKKETNDLVPLLYTDEAPYALLLAKRICERYEHDSKLGNRTIGPALNLKWNHNADHYYSKRYMKKPPYWAKGKTPTHTVGDHIFYKLRLR